MECEHRDNGHCQVAAQFAPWPVEWRDDVCAECEQQPCGAVASLVLSAAKLRDPTNYGEHLQNVKHLLPPVPEVPAERIERERTKGKFFERCFVVNLSRRPDRWEQFKRDLPEDWPFPEPERVEAVDGARCLPPEWWKAGMGAWGCYRSHLKIIEHCLNVGIQSFLILEDDAIFPDDFTARAKRLMATAPCDWQWIYFGGQHHRQRHGLPRCVDSNWCKPFNVNRTHAYALRGNMARVVYEWLNSRKWKDRQHIDHFYGVLHERGTYPIYAPQQWLIGQREGHSNIFGKVVTERWWHHKTQLLPVVAVVGPFRGGTSCVAGILHHLGVSMGDRLKPPRPACPRGFFEAQQLGHICRRSFQEPWMRPRRRQGKRVAALRQWLAGRSQGKNAKLLGAKHPTLSLMVRDMVEAWPDVRLVVVDRSIDESIASIRRLGWGWPQNAAEEVVPKMLERRDRDLSECNAPQLRLKFSDVLADPTAAVDKLIEFCDIEPSDEQKAAAIAFVDPTLHRCQQGARCANVS